MTVKMKKNVYDISALAFIILVIPFYKPGYFDSVSVLDTATNTIRVLFAVLISFLYIKKEKYYSKTLLCLLMFELVFLISTIINGLSIFVFVKNNVLQMAIFLLFSMYSSRPQLLIKTVFIIAEVLVYLNLLTVFLFPNGMYVNITQNWLLGYKNYYLHFFIGFMIVSLLYNHYLAFSYRPYILIITMIFTLYVVKSSTSLFVFAIFVAMVILANIGNERIFNIWTYTIINIVLFCIMVMGRKISFFGLIIKDIFHKDFTLSGRTRIWDSVIRLIEQKPILGWGLLSYDESIGLIGLTTGTHAHNTILQYIYTGGFISLFFWGLFYYYIANRLWRYRETYTAKVLSISIFAYSIGCLAETYSSGLVFVMFALADNIEKLLPYENSVSRQIIKIHFSKRR